MDVGVQIIGAGGHAKVVASTLQALKIKVVALFDDNHKSLPGELMGIPIKGSVDNASNELKTYLAIGHNEARKKISDATTLHWGEALVHPRAWVDPSVQLGLGTVVFAGAMIQADTVVGNHAIINTGATVDHDCKLSDFVHVGPGCNLCGGVTVGAATLLGVGTKVIPNINIGSSVLLGAGSVVIGDVQDSLKKHGVPVK